MPCGDQTSRRVPYLDLQPLANQRLTESADTPGNELAALPRGEQSLGGVRYRIGDRYVVLRSKGKSDRPLKVKGIKVGTPFRKLYVLHAVHNSVPAGTPVGSYTIRYTEGKRGTISLAYGRDLSDWWSGADSGEPARALPAWSGDNAVAKASGRCIRLYQTVWINPYPEKEVVAIDFASANGQTAPFCVAMTIEKQLLGRRVKLFSPCETAGL